MKVYLKIELLRKFEKMGDYFLTILVAPFGSGKTTTLKYYMNTRSNNRRMYIDCRITITGQQLRKKIEKKKMKDKPFFVILDHLSKEQYHELHLHTYYHSGCIDNLHFIVLTDDFLTVGKAYFEFPFQYVTSEYFQMTTVDIEQLCSKNEIFLTMNQIQVIYEASGGWPLAVCYFFEQLMKSEKVVMSEEIFYYLDQVFSKEKEIVHDSLFISLALVNSFPIKLLDTIALSKEYSLNLYVFIRSFWLVKEVNSNRYAFHPLLKRYLMERNELVDAKKRQFHISLGDWFYNNQEPLHALNHYFQAQEYDLVFNLLNDTIKLNLVDDDVVIMKHIYESLPYEKMKKNPFIFLKVILDMYTTIDYNHAFKLLDNFISLLENNEFQEDENTLWGEVHMLLAYIHFGNIDEMYQNIQVAHTKLKGNISRISNPNLIVLLGSAHFFYVYYRDTQNLLHIKEMMKYYFQNYLDLTDNNGKGMNVLAFAEYDMETGAYEKVERQAWEAYYLGKSTNQDAICISALFLIGRFAYITRQEEKLKVIIFQLENYDVYGKDLLIYEIQSALGYLYSLKKDILNLTLWIQSRIELKHDITLYGYWPLGLCYIHLNDLQRAIGIAKVLLSFGSEQKMMYPMIYGNLLLCNIYLKLNEFCQGQVHFDSLLRLCEQSKIVSPFLEFEEYLYPYFIAYCKNKKLNAFELELSDAMLKYSRGYKLSSMLSKKEREICDYLIHGYDKISICGFMKITINTFQFHLKNIYRKLGVSNRKEFKRIYAGK